MTLKNGFPECWRFLFHPLAVKRIKTSFARFLANISNMERGSFDCSIDLHVSERFALRVR